MMRTLVDFHFDFFLCLIIVHLLVEVGNNSLDVQLCSLILVVVVVVMSSKPVEMSENYEK
jgi:hypothetical protein